MARPSVGKEAGCNNARCYERHRPEQTLLYRRVEQHYPAFAKAMEAQDKSLQDAWRTTAWMQEVAQYRSNCRKRRTAGG